MLHCKWFDILIRKATLILIGKAYRVRYYLLLLFNQTFYSAVLYYLIVVELVRKFHYFLLIALHLVEFINNRRLIGCRLYLSQ